MRRRVRGRGIEYEKKATTFSSLLYISIIIFSLHSFSIYSVIIFGSSFTIITEEKIVKKFLPEYMLNRTAGGIGSFKTYTDDELSAKLAVLANRKKRDLISFLNIERLKSIVSESEFEYYIKRYPELLKK